MATPHPLAGVVPGLTVGQLGPPGRQLRWLTAGAGGPPIVLVSGAGETALDWLPILAKTAALSTVVAVDRAGLGLSDPAADLSVQSQVDDLAAVLAQTGPAILVGHSWGGLLVQLVAWQHPASVAGLVLVDPSHEEVTASIPLRWRLIGGAMGPAISLLYRVGLFPRLARPMGRRLAALTTPEPDRRATVEAAYLTAYRGPRQVAMIARENRLGRNSIAFVRNARAGNRPPAVPVIVLTASKGKPPALQEQSTRLLAAVAAEAPRGRQVVVADSGHYIHHDQPDAVVASIAAVLAEVRPPS